MPEKEIRTASLVTPFENGSFNSWAQEYPRPQMKRDSYISLCGEWELSVRKDSVEQPVGKIAVPFPPESRISGIERPLASDEKYIYRRTFMIEKDFNRGRVLLHFGAADQIAEVYVNGKLAGRYVGGYMPFSLDISGLIALGENDLCVEITDTLDTDLPYGKQSRKRGGMWYTPISGIWQPVWIESVPENYIRSLRCTPALDSVTIDVDGGAADKTLILHTESGNREYRFSGNSVKIDIEAPVLWTPEQPYLYTFTLTDGTDTVVSYFGLRTITIEHNGRYPYICLNGEPYFFHGLLDQGYFSDGIYTPASPEGYIYDITTMKRLGFNMLRKHIKIEPELFYYYCDKYGMIVFQDLVNSGKYNFLIDTALPTAGIRRGIAHKATEKRRDQFESDAVSTVELLYNHPCVCYYTIFNEGWGQYDADRIYRELKQLDPTRVWDATSGWFTEKESDVKSEHIYFKKLSLKSDKQRPLVLSEFGGYSCRVEGHCFNLDKNYGYKTCETEQEFSAELEKLYTEQLVPAIRNGLCAAVLTQLSDVEDETNGIVTYDRQIIKPDEHTMHRISRLITEEFRNNI